ncbi:hypothetical protein [Nodularia sp. NIES-3585]|uniref:hypothetical protein n=1 Tax=Nodularia sp. NIES-3585 TaxID=1973477 RepID=UPI000B5C7A0E|nr:hypothetical protein [Nodularia sp. NIES-3585]GAX39004.1 hypothetical protein NIES3585_50560 [Nodularia sp. NIES-3585]
MKQFIQESHQPKTILISAFCLLNLLVLNSGKAFARSARVVYSQDAQGITSSGIDLKVWNGYGLSINFIPSGEIIKQVWIGDPTRISFTSNGGLCQKTESNQECTNAGATVLFLRHIQPIKFPHLTSSSDGSTQMTILTSGAEGQKQYQFKLTPATGQPSYTSLIIKPDSERPKPLLLAEEKPPVITESASAQETVTSNNHQNNHAEITPPTRTLTPGSTIQRNDANAIAYGLLLAVQNGELKPDSTNWRKAQDAIRLLRRGRSRDEALTLSGMPASLFEQLINWGKAR